MVLKTIVDGLLKERNRPMSWLAEEMSKTFDGLKLSLIKGSIKYNDLIETAKILEVAPSIFFQTNLATYNLKGIEPQALSESKENYSDVKANLKNCREMLAALKEQIKDKETIISLLSRDR